MIISIIIISWIVCVNRGCSLESLLTRMSLVVYGVGIIGQF